MNDTPESKDVLKGTRTFKSKGDWINTVLDEHATTHGVGAVEAQEEVKDADGKVTQKAVRGKKGKSVTNMEALRALAEANHLGPKLKESYANAGMARMTIGNMLRAAARNRGGLWLDGAFVNAPSDFEVKSPLTEDPEGNSLKKKAADAEADAA